MHIQDLPMEVFKLLLQHIALALGVQSALRLRLVSRIFANEMIEAMIASGVLDETIEDHLASHMGPMGQELLLSRCPDETLKARYLYSRAQNEPSGSVEFIDHLRLITTEFVSKSGGRYNYVTALKTLCSITAQNFNLSRVLAENSMPWTHFVISRYPVVQACLNVACGLGDLDLVSTLLQDKDIELNHTAPEHFLSLSIRAAIRGGHTDVVEFLLQRGSRIEKDIQGTNEWTVIYDAVLSGDPAMLAFLLEKNLEFPEREGQAGERLGSAYEDGLVTAANQDNNIAFRMLQDKGPIKAPFPVRLQQLVLMAACEGRSLSIAQAIFDMNPSLDPNYDLTDFVSYRCAFPPREYQRQSPLQAAAYWGSMPLVELLLNHGADPNWSNRYGKPALYRAASQGYDRCKDMLLLAGADIASLED